MYRSPLKNFFLAKTTHRFPKLVTLAVSSSLLVALVNIDASASTIGSRVTHAVRSEFIRKLGSESGTHPYSGVVMRRPPVTTTSTATGGSGGGASTTTTTTPPTTTTTSTIVAPSSPQPAGDIAGPWNLVFDSEFNGSSLDASQWSTDWFGSGNTDPIDPTYGLDVNAASQVSVGGGSLQINAILKTNTSPQGTFPYTSGAITTLSDAYPWTPLFSLTYGYVEARIWLPAKGSAVADWPAFWMYSVALTHTYPNGEIDILEGLGGSPEAHMLSSLGQQGPLTGGGTYAGGWHTFAVDWEPNAVTYYYDGVSIGDFTTQIPSTPMFLILNLEVSTILSPPAVPASMRVAYVRVWQH
jgi:beta-glucanase (GH16 family)